MPSKIIVPWWRRLGEIGESEIRTRLLYFSYPWEPTFDIGIDFYCELAEDGVPSKKFFNVQAKGTQHFDNRWGRSFDKATIDFWLGQPYPVYIIVYDENTRNCYWMSIEERRESLIEKMKSVGKETVYITMDKSNVLKKGRNDEFIRRIKQDWASSVFRLNLLRGTPQPIGEGYVRRRPLLYLSKELIAIIRDRVRISMNYLITHYLLVNDVAKAFSLCELLTKFDKGHYDHFVMFGKICASLGRVEEACLSYEQAINICRKDKNWNRLKRPSDPSIEEIIALIEKEMTRLDCNVLMRKKTKTS